MGARGSRAGAKVVEYIPDLQRQSCARGLLGSVVTACGISECSHDDADQNDG